MITNETYRHQIVLQNNFLANMAIVFIHKISKKEWKTKQNMNGIKYKELNQ